tara:strand:- start:165 stop:467 length:303 start_codon:yes stop_codon:yes gene_type:complete
MCEQTGEEIDWERCPPEPEDFPAIVTDAIQIYHSLGDRIYPDVGFVGKDYTNLDLLFNFYKITEPTQKEYVLEILLHIERRTRKESQDQIKAAYDKIKKK